MKITNKRVRELTTIALVAAASLLSAVSMAAPDNVGFVYVSPIGDAGWTYQHDQGRLQLENTKMELDQSLQFLVKQKHFHYLLQIITNSKRFATFII